jgi:DNA-directed RNA polymerase I, II, and III subunit RPABC2
MSDDEYYSDNDSGSENSDTDVVTSNKKPLFRPSNNIKTYSTTFNDIDDSEPDDVGDDVSESDEENQSGGADEEGSEEGEIVEDDEGSEEGEIVEDENENNSDNENDIELNEDGEPIQHVPSQKSSNKVTTKNKQKPLIIQDEEDEEDDEYDDNYLQKFDNEIMKNYIYEFHPECLNHNYEEIKKLSIVTKNSDGIIIDPLHKTIPYLTKYERARILGQRAKQIETGAKPLVKVPENIVDSYIIADLELREKKIPFIIRRPVPGGGSEYWNLKDLEVIAF